MKLLWLAGATMALCLFTASAAFADSTGLIAAYGFEETGGTAAVDSAGGLNPGTLNGPTRSASGRFGSALSFDGINDRVDVADSNSLDLTTGMTLEAWVRPAASGWRTALLKEGTGSLAYALYASTDTNRPSTEIQAETRGPAALPASTWSHLSSTYDGATLRLYVNGAEVSSRAVSGSIAVSSGALRIGGNALWGEYFSGLIDEVRVYNRALTAAEIGTDMNRAVVAADTQPPTIPALSGTVTEDDIRLSWTASTDDVGVKEYRVYRDGALIGTTAATTRSFDDTDRPAGTQRYTVVAADAAGNASAASNEVALTVAPDTTPPTFTIGAWGLPAGTNYCPDREVSDYVPLLQATFKDERGPVTGRVEVDGKTIQGPATVAKSGGWQFDFETVGLSDGPHLMKGIARDAAGNEGTVECTWHVNNPDLTVPFIAPGEGQAVSGIVTIRTNAQADGTTPSGDWAVDLQGAQGATATGPTPTQAWTWDTRGLSDGPRTLTASLYYHGYISPRATSTIHVTVDNTVPPAPSLVANLGGDDVHLTWTAASDPSGIKEYRVYRDGTLIASPTATSYDDLDRPAGTPHYKVVAVDKAGNASAVSNDVSVTIAGADTTPPTIDGLCPGLTAQQPIHDYITLRPTYSDDQGPVTVRIELDGQTVYGPVTFPGASGAFLWDFDTLGKLTNGTHVLRGIARDAAGNEADTGPCSWDVYNPAVTVPITSHDDGDTISGSSVKFTADVLGDGQPLVRPALGFTWEILDASGTRVSGGNDLARPFEFNFPAGMAADGWYTVKVSTSWLDYAGPLATNSIRIQVKNAPAAPANLRTDVRDDDIDLLWDAIPGVNSYDVYRDGVKIANTGGSFYTDGDRPVGTYHYTVKALGGNAESDASNEATATVAADTTPPSVSIQEICHGEQVSGGNVSLTVQYSDNRGGVTAWVEIDGTRAAGPWTDTGATRRVDLSTTGLANGPHAFTAVARDTAGNTKTSQPCVYDVQNATAPPPPVGLVAAYGFEETSGTTAADSSGKGSTGTVSGATPVTGGKFGRALSFDGINDLVTVPDANALDLAPGMTLEAWVKPTTVSGWRTALLKERPGQLSYALYAAADNGRPQTEISAGASREARGTAALTAGAWSHLAATYDGTTLRLYVNGAQVSSTAATGTLFNSTGALRIGGNKIWGEYFSGLIDEVRVYERALTPAEIQADGTRPVVPGS
jgi:fibronectin type 3 domain-containing protein